MEYTGSLEAVGISVSFKRVSAKLFVFVYMFSAEAWYTEGKLITMSYLMVTRKIGVFIELSMSIVSLLYFSSFSRNFIGTTSDFFTG